MSVGSIGTALNAYSVQSVGKPAAQTTPSAVTSSESVVVAISAKAAKVAPSSISDAITAYQAASYAGTLDRLGPISISDTSANFGANFAILADMASRSKITSIKLTDKNASITTTTQALGNLADSNSAGAKLLSTLESKLIVKLQNISASVATTLKSPTKNVDFQFSISDSAIAISSNFEAISTLSKKKGALSSIIISGANNILSLSAAQLKSSATTLSLISNNYALNVQGATTKDISTLEKNTNITSISITDSASNVLKSAAVLKASSKGISSIILNDTKDVTLSINQAKTLKSFDNVTMVSAGYTISDEALTVITHIRYDLRDIISGAKTVSINDKKPANLTVNDSLALRSIKNLSPSTKYNIVDTVDAITTTNSEATSAMDAAETVTVSGSYTIEQAKAILGKKKVIQGTPIAIRDTVSNILAESQKANFGTLANALTVTVSDTAANVASNIDRLQTLAEKNTITIINLTDNSTQTLSLTSDQWNNNVEAIGKISSKVIKFSFTGQQLPSLNGSYYKVVYDHGVSRSTAAAAANHNAIFDGALYHGHLVTLNNAVEDTFLQSIIKQDNNNSFFTSDPSSFWTGGEFLNGNWQWTSDNQIINSNSYSNWTGQESSQGNREPYIILHMMTGYWFSLGGVAPGNIKGYIIEYDR